MTLHSFPQPVLPAAPWLTSGQFPSRPLGQRPLSGMCGCVQGVLQTVAHAADRGLRPGRDLRGQSQNQFIFFQNLVHMRGFSFLSESHLWLL